MKKFDDLPTPQEIEAARPADAEPWAVRLRYYQQVEAKYPAEDDLYETDRDRWLYHTTLQRAAAPIDLRARMGGGIGTLDTGGEITPAPKIKP